MSRPSAWPWWVQVLAVYAAIRALTGLAFVAAASTQAPNIWTGASPSYAEYTGLMWDGSWYRTIAEQGYPATLPTRPDGTVDQNAWAFFPLFPLLVRPVMAVTGGAWHVVAPTVALLLGAVAMLLVHQVVAAVTARVAGRHRALPLVSVALLSSWAAAPVLQVGYTESLALLLLAGALLCLVRRWYLPAIPVVLALGLTRAVALPLLAAVVAHGVARLRAARQQPGAHGRPADPFDPRERLGLVALAAATLAAGLLWPAVCGLVTGYPDGYARTQAAWRGRAEVVPLIPWIDVARWLFGDWGLVLLVAVVTAAVLLLLSPDLHRLGPELTWWTAGYLGYLLVVVEPGTSLVRFLLLAFPVAGVLAQAALRSSRSRLVVALLLGLGLVSQVAWVALLWRLVPPAGWPP